MKARRSVAAVIAIVSALLLGVTGVAEAVNLFTAPLFVTREEGVGCALVNVGAGNSTVTIKVRDASGTEVDSVGPNVVAVGDVLSIDFLPDGSNYFYCKFISSSSSVRVAIARFICCFNGDLNGYGMVK